MSTSKLSMKLYINKESNKFLFAEAGKEAIDFLFSLITLPVSRIISLLLSNEGMVGCVENLYKSIEALNSDYLQDNENRNLLLEPKIHTLTQQSSLFNLTNEPKQIKPQKIFYRCNDVAINTRAHHYVTDNQKNACPDCSRVMNIKVPFVGLTEVANVKSGGADRGFVKGVLTYMVMDDLVVKPMSTTSTIALLATLNVTDVETIEERVVYLDAEMRLKLLKATFQSKNVLSSIFLPQEDPSAVEV